MPEEDLEQIVERAKQGDQEAVALLYERFVDIIYRYVMHMYPPCKTSPEVVEKILELRHVYQLGALRITEYVSAIMGPRFENPQ